MARDILLDITIKTQKAILECSRDPNCYKRGYGCRIDCLYKYLKKWLGGQFNLNPTEFRELMRKCIEEVPVKCTPDILAVKIYRVSRGLEEPSPRSRETAREQERKRGTPRIRIKWEKLLADLLKLKVNPDRAYEYCSRPWKCIKNGGSVVDILSMIYCEALRLHREGLPAFKAEKKAVDLVGERCGASEVVEALSALEKEYYAGV